MFLLKQSPSCGPGVACMMFWLISFFMPKKKVLLKDSVILLVCALCGAGINQWLFVVGLKSSSPINASIIATTVPIFVLLLAAIILKERITTKKSFGVFMGLSGGLLLIFSSTYTANSTNSLRGPRLWHLCSYLWHWNIFNADYGQHVQLCTAYYSFRDCNPNRTRHIFVAKSIVCHVNFYRCLFSYTELEMKKTKSKISAK